MKDKQLLITHKRAIVCGKVIELFDYEKPVVKNYVAKHKGRAGQAFTDEETKAENRKKVTNRARKNVRRYANANTDLDKFITLTFAYNMTDIDSANAVFHIFLTKLRKDYPQLKFIKVIEFQRRGAIHYHMLSNLPYIAFQDFFRYWSYGFYKLNRIDNVDNVGAYITKYMCKELDERLKGYKAYSMSQNLTPPVVFEDEESVEYLMANNADNVKRVYECEFESEHYGLIQYKQIVLNTVAIKDKIDKNLYRIAKKHGIWLSPYKEDDPSPF